MRLRTTVAPFPGSPVAARLPGRVAALLLLTCVIKSWAAPAAPEGFTFSAPVQKIRPSGIRLEGNATQPARIHSPEIDVSAAVIAFDFQGSQIQQVRAEKNVKLKLDLAGKGPDAKVSHIDATCDSARLDPGPRTLLLKGNIHGYYQAGEIRSDLSGDEALLHYVGTSLVADMTGGAQGISLSIPAESFGTATALGPVLVTAGKASFNSADGAVHFIGNAHAVSSEGADKFDVQAPEFTVTRGAAGSIGTLVTTGRTRMKFDLPPAAQAAPIPVTTQPGAGAAAHRDLPRPTHVEVEADKVTVTRATQTVICDGNVQGFYRIAPAGQPAQDYNFSADHVQLRDVTEIDPATGKPEGLNVDLTGRPGEVRLPALNLDLGKAP